MGDGGRFGRGALAHHRKIEGERFRRFEGWRIRRHASGWKPIRASQLPCFATSCWGYAPPAYRFFRPGLRHGRVIDGLPDDDSVNLFRLHPEPDQQTHVAEVVDSSRHALCLSMNLLEGITGEDLPLRAGPGKPEVDVLHHLVEGERAQMVADGDPGVELFDPLDDPAQLRLADEQQVEQEPVVELVVEQQPDLLEIRRREQLRLVDDEERHLVLLEIPHHHLAQRVQQIVLGVRRRVEAELVEDLADELDGLEHGVRDETHVIFLLGEVLDESAGKRRLSATHVPREQRGPLAAHDGVRQAGHRLAVVPRVVDELQVRNDLVGVDIEAPVL